MPIRSCEREGGRGGGKDEEMENGKNRKAPFDNWRGSQVSGWAEDGRVLALLPLLPPLL